VHANSSLKEEEEEEEEGRNGDFIGQVFHHPTQRVFPQSLALLDER
jgi:hypothetical protein